MIDAADAAEVGRFNWTAFVRPGTVYAERHVDGATVLLHRFVASLAGEVDKRTVDHRDGNGLNCRRSNLRPASQRENLANRGAQINSRSGVKGVCYYARDRLWVASVKAGDIRRQGRFKGKEDAIAAVLAWRSELHGEFANDGAIH